MKKMSLIVAIKDYFGFKPGQSMHDFMQEVKELTSEDRAYFTREFIKVGYEIT